VVFLIGLKLIDIANMREILRLRKDEFWVDEPTDPGDGFGAWARRLPLQRRSLLTPNTSLRMR
jgi:hypothetical protein